MFVDILSSLSNTNTFYLSFAIQFKMTRKKSYKSAVQEFTDSNVWSCHVPVSASFAQEFIDNDRRIICCINGIIFHAAFMHDGNGDYFVNLNKEIMKKADLTLGSELQLEVSKDRSKYGTFTPDFFEELCYQDPEGSELFHALTIGKQRGLLHIIAKPKSENKQLEKALTVFDYLKVSGGELDYKALNEAFKNSRFKQ